MNDIVLYISVAAAADDDATQTVMTGQGCVEKMFACMPCLISDDLEVVGRTD